MEKYSIDSGCQVVNVGTRRGFVIVGTRWGFVNVGTRRRVVNVGTRRRVVNVGTRRGFVNVGPDRQVVYCRPGVPFPGTGKVGRFPVPETLLNLQGRRQDLARSPNFEWYLHNPGRSGHCWSDLGPGFTGFLLKGLRSSPVAFTCELFASWETSMILSASFARSLMSVLSDRAKIWRTSGGSCAKKNALTNVVGSALRLWMC